MASAMRTIYHVKHGASTIHAVDAIAALAHHPAEWRDKNRFTAEERLAYLKKEVEDAAAKAEYTGKPEDSAAADRLNKENEKLAKEIKAHPAAQEPEVEIPEGWQDMKPLQRINLAVQLGAERKGLTAAKADELIEAEIEAREAPEKPAENLPAA